MGIFGGGYDKPGKGVDKNEPKKKGFFLFFDIVIRKFTKFLGANCLYAITSIIWIAILYIFGGIVLSSTHIVQNVSDTIISLGTESSAGKCAGKHYDTYSACFFQSVCSRFGVQVLQRRLIRI